MNKKILIVIVVLTVIFSVSTFFIIKYHYQSNATEQLYQEVYESMSEPETKQTLATENADVDKNTNPYANIPENSGVTTSDTSTSTNVLSAEKNEDMVGWIKIEGTKINYPVMFTPNEPDFYLNHDFYKNENIYGCPYVQANCNVVAPSDNVIIYGHSMNDGTMFAELEKFKSKDFWKSHKKISFDTLNKKGTYEIMVVFAVSVDDANDNSFKFYEFVNSYDPQHFRDFVNKCKSLSFYNTGINAEYGDKLLTLSTCDYTHNNGRLVVVAKKLTDK